jgi:succinate dehydrogenase/fumarate reductase flavoprotein subunit
MLHAVPPGQEVDSWLICTRAFQRRYGLGIARPAPLPLRPYIRSGYVKVGGTIAELARNCGIDPEGLERTVTEYNVHAREGEDLAYGRGSTSYNRYQRDAGNKPNPCVAPIERGPFYAVKVLPGSFGTFAGLKADASSRVLDANDVPIPVFTRPAPRWRASWAVTTRPAESYLKSLSRNSPASCLGGVADDLRQRMRQM